MRRALVAAVAVVGLLPTWGPPARGQVDFPAAAFSGYAAGTAIHADALQAASEGPRLADGEVGFSAAAVDAAGFRDSVVNEMEQSVQPAAEAGKKAHGRGSGIEVGLATGVPNDPNGNQVIPGGLAEASAPPSSGVVAKEVGPLTAGPLAYASLTRGQAHPIFSDSVCVLGQPISFGLGYAADVQFLDAGSGAPDGTLTQPLVATPADRRASQSTSVAYLAANGDGTFAFVSETRQTFAPVTLFRGTPEELTVEVLGEWVLRAGATGKPGGASIEYGPEGSPDPTTPVIRLVQGGQATQVTFEQFLGSEGVLTPANPAVDVTVARDPRRLATPGETVDPTAPPETDPDGTLAAAAVDVVRLTVVHQPPADTPRALELRIGHMEARALVPLGGIRCRLPLVQTSDTDRVTVGQSFSWSTSIPATPDAGLALACDLLGVRVVDTVVPEPGVKLALVSTSDGGITDGETATWPDLGTYHPGDPPLGITLGAEVAPQSAPGLVTSLVEGSGVLGNCRGGAGGPKLLARANLDGVILSGIFVLEAPMVIPRLVFVE